MATLFSDDFETGALAAGWVETPAGAGGPRVLSNTPYHGTYYLYMVSVSKLSASFSAPASKVVAASLAYRQGTNSTSTVLALTDGTTAVATLTCNGATSTFNGTTVSFNLNDAYHVVRVLCDQISSDPVAVLWIDGTQYASVSIAGANPVTTLSIANATSGGADYYDQVVVQDNSFSAYTYRRSLIEGLVLTPALVRVAIRAKTIASTLLLTPILTRVLTRVQALSATLHLTPIQQASRAIVGTATLSAAPLLGRVTHLTRTYTAQLPMTPTLTHPVLFSRVFNVVLRLTPVQTATRTLSIALTTTWRLLPSTLQPALRVIGFAATLRLLPVLGTPTTFLRTLAARALLLTPTAARNRVINKTEGLQLHDTLPSLPPLPLIRLRLITHTVRRILRVRGPSQH